MYIYKTQHPQGHPTNLKTPMTTPEKTNLIYHYPFSCGSCYIGQTGRHMADRIQEHSADIRLRDKPRKTERGKPAVHVKDHKCEAHCDDAQIICSAGNTKRKREILESALIYHCPTRCIAQPSFSVPTVWLDLCKAEATCLFESVI